MVVGSIFGCFPPEHPDLENPPCIVNLMPDPKPKLRRENAEFVMIFSKQLEPTTVHEDNIYLIKDPIDRTFLRDIESPPILESRRERLVPLEIKFEDIEDAGGKRTKVTARALNTLQGDSIYQFVLTKNLRDKLVELTEFRRTGLRPLNKCPDENGIWRGLLDEYRAGRSDIFQFETEPAPPPSGLARIVEVMSTPNIANGEYVEIANAHKSENLTICGMFLNNNKTPREITAFQGRQCRDLKPGELAVIIEPDYNIHLNEYKIPNEVLLLTTKGSTSTLLSDGLSSGDTIMLYRGNDLAQMVSPGEVTTGNWPSKKSLEKCVADGKDDRSNWQISNGEFSGGTPGRPNPNTCK
jgi:hypothetical protein